MGNTLSNQDSQGVLAIVALVVSLVALVATILQALQQYFSSADGYRKCAASTMGIWAKGTHRKLRLREFRIEVIYETPVIFTTYPDNRHGPIRDKEIYYIDGTDESYRNTRVSIPAGRRMVEGEVAAILYTTDDERASWITLLSALQLKESMSRKWDLEFRMKFPPRGRPLGAIDNPNYSLAVGLQSKMRSWDFIPSSITRPYAISAVCYLVEMMSMLGLYWKVFDQSTWNLRAEGNGFILTSTTVHGLGIMVVFAMPSNPVFGERRVIPCLAIRELAFGTVPNIFDDETYLSEGKGAQSLELVFGSAEDVANTLESLGCQEDTLKNYNRGHKHLFSVTFEIIGMLGKVFRIRGSNFRMLPNPTGDLWHKTVGTKASWKITKLMEVFQAKLHELIYNEGLDSLESGSSNITAIRLKWNQIQDLNCTDEAKLSIEVREAIHDAIDETTKYLLSVSQLDLLSVLVAHITKIVKELEDPFSPLNTIAFIPNKEEALVSYYFYEVRPVVINTPRTNTTRLPPPKTEVEQWNTIWIMLIFRMLCWLLLHDFDENDAKIVPSNLKGSRMPVYIG